MADLKFEVKDVQQYQELIGALEARYNFDVGSSVRNRTGDIRFVYLFDRPHPNVEFDPDEDFFRNDSHYILTNTEGFISLYGGNSKAHPHRDLMLQYADDSNFRVERLKVGDVWVEETPPRFTPHEQYRAAVKRVDEHPYAPAIRACATDTSTPIMIRIRSSGEEYEYLLGVQDFGYEENVDMFVRDTMKEEVQAVMGNPALLAAIKRELGV